MLNRPPGDMGRGFPRAVNEKLGQGKDIRRLIRARYGVQMKMTTHWPCATWAVAVVGVGEGEGGMKDAGCVGAV